jgi:hypothetical protein
MSNSESQNESDNKGATNNHQNGTENITISTSSEQTVQFTESEAYPNELPEGWEEVYYAEGQLSMNGGPFKLVKAIYEHIPTGTKIAITPSPDVTLGETPQHSIAEIVPLKHRSGTAAFNPLFKEMRGIIASIIPNFDPINEDSPIYDTLKHTDQELDLIIKSQSEYDWGQFADHTINRLKTQDKESLEYAIKNCKNLHSLSRINDNYPDTISTPIKTEIIVDEINGQKQIRLDGGRIERISNYHHHIVPEGADFSTLEVGDTLAYVELTFDQRSRYEKQKLKNAGEYLIQSIEFTEAGAGLHSVILPATIYRGYVGLRNWIKS